MYIVKNISEIILRNVSIEENTERVLYGSIKVFFVIFLETMYKLLF